MRQGRITVLPQAWECEVAEWMAVQAAAGHSEASVRTRRGIVRAIAHKLGTPTPDVAGGQLLALAAAADWSRDYRRSVRTALRSFYGWRVTRGLAEINVADVLPVVPESRPRPRPAPDAVMARALAAGERERLMARLGAEAGLRRAEIARVRADDLIDDVGGWSLIVTGKGARQRTVPISDDLAQAIRSYRDPGGRNAGGWLFGGQCDGHISPGHVGKLLSRAMGEGWSAHKLRHRYASRGFAGTGDLVAVQRNLGHSSLQTTQRYVATTDRAARAVSEAASSQVAA